MLEIEGIKSRHCPFCGGYHLRMNTGVGVGMVECMDDDCMTFGPSGDSAKLALEAWNTRPYIKHLEHMIESHMNVIDKQLASIKELEQEARVGEERFAELEGYYGAAERIIERMNEEYKELEEKLASAEAEATRYMLLADAYSDVTKAKELEAEVAKLHRYLDLMEVSDYYDDFECVHEWELTPHYRGIEHGEHALCSLCGASTETDDPIVKNLQRERIGK